MGVATRKKVVSMPSTVSHIPNRYPVIKTILMSAKSHRFALAVSFAALVGSILLPSPAFAASSTAPRVTFHGSQTQTHSRSKSGIVPDSASGCNDAVCIDVNGSGNYVNWVQENGTATDVGCTYGRLWSNGALIGTSNETCWSSVPTYLQDFWSLNSNFATGTQLCVDYYPLVGAPTGMPCETVE